MWLGFHALIVPTAPQPHQMDHSKSTIPIHNISWPHLLSRMELLMAEVRKAEDDDDKALKFLSVVASNEHRPSIDFVLEHLQHVVGDDLLPIAAISNGIVVLAMHVRLFIPQHICCMYLEVKLSLLDVLDPNRTRMRPAWTLDLKNGEILALYREDCKALWPLLFPHLPVPGVVSSGKKRIISSSPVSVVEETERSSQRQRHETPVFLSPPSPAAAPFTAPLLPPHPGPMETCTAPSAQPAVRRLHLELKRENEREEEARAIYMRGPAHAPEPDPEPAPTPTPAPKPKAKPQPRQEEEEEEEEDGEEEEDDEEEKAAEGPDSLELVPKKPGSRHTKFGHQDPTVEMRLLLENSPHKKLEEFPAINESLYKDTKDHTVKAETLEQYYRERIRPMMAIKHGKLLPGKHMDQHHVTEKSLIPKKCCGSECEEAASVNSLSRIRCLFGLLPHFCVGCISRTPPPRFKEDHRNGCAWCCRCFKLPSSKPIFNKNPTQTLDDMELISVKGNLEIVPEFFVCVHCLTLKAGELCNQLRYYGFKLSRSGTQQNLLRMLREGVVPGKADMENEALATIMTNERFLSIYSAKSNMDELEEDRDTHHIENPPSPCTQQHTPNPITAVEPPPAPMEVAPATPTYASATSESPHIPPPPPPPAQTPSSEVTLKPSTRIRIVGMRLSDLDEYEFQLSGSDTTWYDPLSNPNMCNWKGLMASWIQVTNTQFTQASQPDADAESWEAVQLFFSFPELGTDSGVSVFYRRGNTSRTYQRTPLKSLPASLYHSVGAFIRKLENYYREKICV